ncbi:MAG: hypothetical protein H6841_04805 [Planctomycetes bacterium]|nr:hypothetical protein [Planctomycetota bacterium]
MSLKMLLLLGLAVMVGLPLGAQNPYLATAIGNHFTVSAGPPVTMVPSSGTWYSQAKAVHNYMVAQGYNGSSPVTTVVNGVDIMWGAGAVSWANDQVIVLATSTALYNDASATVTGDESSAYAVVIQPGFFGIPGRDGGSASASDTGQSGGATLAIAGDAVGDSSSVYHGGTASASSIDGTAYADAGNGSLLWNGAGGNGGDATAIGGGQADAIAGAGAGTGDGGDAYAESDTDIAYAEGGDTLSGDGGDAEAIAPDGAQAYGGSATSTSDVASYGGAATASTTNGLAWAVAGNGNFPQLALATSAGANGDAHAFGGQGIGAGTTLTIDGGEARAVSLYGTAEAEGGDSLATNPGTGGYAYADGSSSGYVDDQPTTWQGGYAVQY